jgi:hypothetical protein
MFLAYGNVVPSLLAPLACSKRGCYIAGNISLQMVLHVCSISEFEVHDATPGLIGQLLFVCTSSPNSVCLLSACLKKPMPGFSAYYEL